MNKNLYIILILFLGLTVVTNIINSVIRFKFGPEIFMFDFYSDWYLVLGITSLIGSVLISKYYYYHNLWFTFFTGLFVVAVSLIYFIVIYILLTSGQLRTYVIPVLLLFIGAEIVYTAGLIFSGTQKKFWLKLAGLCGFIACIVVLFALIGNIYAKDIHVIKMSAEITQWALLAVGLVPILFIMNFLSELRILKTENVSVNKQKFLEGLLLFTGITAFIFTVTFGVRLTIECYSKLDEKNHNNYNVELGQKLVKRSEVRTFGDNEGDSLHYLLIKPQGYDPQKKYPLLVCLPYGGYASPAADLMSENVNRKKYPAFIFVPYCEEGTGWGGIPGHPSRDLLVYETINALADPGIDVKRRYVTGISLGGYGAWQFICARPDMFAASIPVCGGGDPELAPKIVNVAVWAFHGAEDKNVPVSGSQDMIAAMKKVGGHPKYTEFPDDAHNIWDQVRTTPGLWDWLFAQRQE